ncbi:hypothetical protein GGR57DRAFT_494303 [Xylariaceae sp. FL1272]|nr:hypothetical protein GGR57DRAFT_494303 [Xylariaceae sp. FL1272]
MGGRLDLKKNIRWENDAEAGARPTRGFRRHDSTGSLSIRSMRPRHEVDPAVSKQIQDHKATNKIKDATTKELSDLKWHTITTDEAVRRLTTSVQEGLSEAQVARRVKEFGRNPPSPPKSRLLQTWFGYFLKGFGPVLLVGGILVLAIVLLAVFLIQAAFNAFQDWSSSRVMISLPASELVLGDIVSIKAGNKLPADVRFLHASSDAKLDRSILTGESVPLAAAVNSTDDSYLNTRCIGMQGTHCISDQTVFGRIAKLTQEPKVKMTTLEKEILFFVIIICSIMLTAITIVLFVWGFYVHEVHPDYISVPTLIVDIVGVATAFIPEGLPIALTAGLTITANLMRNNKILCKSLKTVETLGAVSVICSDKTGTLTAVRTRNSRLNYVCHIRSAVANYVNNRMAATHCTIGTHTITTDVAEDELSKSEAASIAGIKTTGLGQVRAISALCNAAEFDAATSSLPLDDRYILGDATDQAVLRFSESLGSVHHMRQCWNKTYELAFNSKNKFIISTFSLFKSDCLAETLSEREAQDFRSTDTLLTIKGAPDVLINRCSSYVTNSGGVHELDDEVKAEFEKVKNLYSSQGKRCILPARRVLHEKDQSHGPKSTRFEDEVLEQAKGGLTLVRLVAIVDPLRPEIADVVRTLRGAGIRIFMVTGDFALTALAIAQDAGIISHPSHLVDDISSLPREQSAEGEYSVPRQSNLISGPELLSLNEPQWQLLTEYEEIVFARTTPEQKLRIVRESQKDGVVAMTVDGVNDAPSLKAADVGIALGSGSDIAVEAADMVLLESFSSVVEAVQYGRTVFDNLKKVICYLLPAGSFAEFWSVITNVIFGLPQILSSFLMIIICCFTDCAAATVLSYEKAEADVLLRKPRNVEKDHHVDWKLVVHAYGVIGFIDTATSLFIPDGVHPDFYAEKLDIASSIYFVNLLVTQWFNLLAVRTRRWSIFQHPPAFNKKTQNLCIFPAILFSLSMVILWLYIPQLHSILRTLPVPVEYWFLPFAFGSFIVLFDEMRNYS